MVSATVACEKDLEDIAIDLAGQKPFDVGDTIVEVIAYNRSVPGNRVDNNNPNKAPLYLLGINRDQDFGTKKSDMVSQVQIPFAGVDFGDNPVIDEVVISIPYFSTRDGDQDAIDPESGLPIEDEEGDTIQVPNFILDSVFGNRDMEYQIRIHELGTFLNSLDPENPTQPKSYYSDRDYELKDLLYDGMFKPNRNDTVYYVERRYLDGNPNTVNDIDTIKAENLAPSMKFSADKEFFLNRFVNHDNPSDFESNDNFARYFRGLYFEALGMDGSLMNLNPTSGTMTIYYSSDDLVNEDEDEDLNYNGIFGEQGIIAKRAKTMVFPLGGVAVGKYVHDYSGTSLAESIESPDMVNGEDRLYVQGAGGTEVVIDLISEELLDELRSKNLLINDASLVFYLDGEQSEIPGQLFLYKDLYGSYVDDYYDLRFGPDQLGGSLEYDDEGNPERYKFRITQYFTNLVTSGSTAANTKLVLKNYVNTDLPDFSNLDTILPDWNYDPRAVVLHGNRPETNEKRIKLELFYSKNP